MSTELYAAARAAGTTLSLAARFASAWSRARTGRRDEALARELLGLADATAYSYRVGHHHPIYAVGEPHPDDRAAFASVLRRAVSPSIEAADVSVMPSVEADLSDGHVLVGSPEADPLTQAVFGYRDVGEFGSEYIGGTIELVYRWEEDSRRVEAEYTKYVPGKGPVSRPNWPIIAQNGGRERRHYPRLDLNGFSTTDWLVLTRLPNVASQIGLQSGRSIISVAGAHGTATRGIELVLSDKSSLRTIGRAISDSAEGFQVLVEVGDIVHDPIRGSYARRARVESVVPLSYSANELERAAAVVEGRWEEWLLAQGQDEKQES